MARSISERSITLVKDDLNQVPLRLPASSSVLYLSVLDYPSGWRIAAPSRTLIPELKKRWPATESIEVSDRSTPNELDLVRAMAAKYDAVIAGVFVRASSGSGRLDLVRAMPCLSPVPVIRPSVLRRPRVKKQESGRRTSRTITAEP